MKMKEFSDSLEFEELFRSKSKPEKKISKKDVGLWSSPMPYDRPDFSSRDGSSGETIVRLSSLVEMTADSS